jgi:hypothetical protein
MLSIHFSKSKYLLSLDLLGTSNSTAASLDRAVILAERSDGYLGYFSLRSSLVMYDPEGFVNKY